MDVMKKWLMERNGVGVVVGEGVRGPTKKKPNTEVKKAPNYKKAATSNAGRKQINELPLDVECSGAVVPADGLNIECTILTSSPLTGGNIIIDEDRTDNGSIQTLSTAARQHESDLDVVVLLDFPHTYVCLKATYAI